MQNDPLFFLRIVSGIGFAVAIAATLYVFNNAGRLFGIDADVPSETESSRTYSKLLIVAVLAHALIFFSVGLVCL